jgi:hypothetical protein
MLQEEIGAILAQVISIGDYIDPRVAGHIYRCRMLPPVPWSRGAIESALNITIPPDLQALWDNAASLHLFEETPDRQWGMMLYSPDEIIAAQESVTDWRKEEGFIDGDIVLGQFWGDLELVILRCDAAAGDFGSVVIADEIYPRADWRTAADTLTQFLRRYLDERGKKYWETKRRIESWDHP